MATGLQQLKLNELKIAQKLPLIIVGCALLMAIGVGVSSYWKAASTIDAATDAKFDAALAARQTSFAKYLTSIEQDLEIMSTSPQVAAAIRNFTRAWNVLGEKCDAAPAERIYYGQSPSDRRKAPAGRCIRWIVLLPGS